METQNNKWLELMVKGIKDNISLCGETEIIARLDGNPVTGSQLLALIESDDPIIGEFYEKLIISAINGFQFNFSNRLILVRNSK